MNQNALVEARFFLLKTLYSKINLCFASLTLMLFSSFFEFEVFYTTSYGANSANNGLTFREKTA